MIQEEDVVIILVIGTIMWYLFYSWRRLDMIPNIISYLYCVSGASIGWCIYEWLHYRRKKKRDTDEEAEE